MKYYIVTNREILIVLGQKQIDTTNDGLCTDSLRFATFDSGNSNPNSYTLIPDKSIFDTASPGTPSPNVIKLRQ
jgi:hypothetical protein